MPTFDEIADMLSEITAAFPMEFFKELNGGVVLINQTVEHEKSKKESPLYILGRYFYDPNGLGRYIHIYYGSFLRVHGAESPGGQKRALRKILSHEFTHHLESLSGERGLERKDEAQMRAYLNG